MQSIFIQKYADVLADEILFKQVYPEEDNNKVQFTRLVPDWNLSQRAYIFIPVGVFESN